MPPSAAGGHSRPDSVGTLHGSALRPTQDPDQNAHCRSGSWAQAAGASSYGPPRMRTSLTSVDGVRMRDGVHPGTSTTSRVDLRPVMLFKAAVAGCSGPVVAVDGAGRSAGLIASAEFQQWWRVDDRATMRAEICGFGDPVGSMRSIAGSRGGRFGSCLDQCSDRSAGVVVRGGEVDESFGRCCGPLS